MKSFITHLGSEHNLPIKGKMLSIGVVTLFGFLGVGVSSQRPPGRKLLVAPGQAGAALWPFLWSSGTPVSLGGGRWRKEKRRGGAIWTFQKTNLPPLKKKKKPTHHQHSGNQGEPKSPKGIARALGLFSGIPCCCVSFSFGQHQMKNLKSLSNEGPLCLSSSFSFKPLREGRLVS